MTVEFSLSVVTCHMKMKKELEAKLSSTSPCHSKRPLTLPHLIVKVIVCLDMQFQCLGQSSRVICRAPDCIVRSIYYRVETSVNLILKLFRKNMQIRNLPRLEIYSNCKNNISQSQSICFW